MSMRRCNNPDCPCHYIIPDRKDFEKDAYKKREINDAEYAAEHVRWTLINYGKDSADKIAAIYAAGKIDIEGQL